MMRVLIVGAGLGGLCLAQGLRGVGIDVEVFERRATAAEQPASYGIHLDSDGLGALRRCLPAASWERLLRSTTPAPDVVRFWSPDERVLLRLDREKAADRGHPTQRRGARRDALVQTLLDGATVHWGKELTHYELSEDGVRAHFRDGSSAHGDLLVGADGSNSRVRQQRLPGLERIDLSIVNVAGRLPLTADLASRLPEALLDGSVNNVVPGGPGWMFVSTWQGESDADRSVVWAWAASRASYPEDLNCLPPQELRQLVTDRIARWSPGLRHLIEATDPATIARIPLRTMPPLEEWSASSVTLLGDAIHNMTPMAGIGANTALRDAGTLCEALTEDHGGDRVARVAAYERRMRAYANDALAVSTRNARSAATESRLQRAAFRSALRVAARSPLVRRALFT